MGEQIVQGPGSDPVARQLRERFGHTAFRPGQEAVIRDIIAGGVRLTVFPTGAGKSLCYLLPAGILPGRTVVVSPLIALMEDQARRAQAAGFRTVIWRGGFTCAGLADAELILLSPEKLALPAVAGRLQQLGVAHLVVDEAHCVFAWGGSFRPAYAALARWVERLGCPRVSLFTATAGPEIRQRLIGQFGVERVFETGADRPNLCWHCRRSPDPVFEAALICRRIPGRIVLYFQSRGGAEEAALFLQRSGAAAACFHAGMAPQLRARLMHRFRNGPLRILCATAAFGMGVDVPDIRAVVHLGVPGNLDSYQQEAGRAGRDGHPALVLLLYRNTGRKEAGFPAGLRMQDLPVGICPETVWVARLCGVLGKPAGVAAWAQLLDSGAVRIDPGSGEPLVIPEATPAGIVRQASRWSRERARRGFQRVMRYLRQRGCRRTALLAASGYPPPDDCGGCDRCGSVYSGLLAECRAELAVRLAEDRQKKPPAGGGDRLQQAAVSRRSAVH